MDLFGGLEKRKTGGFLKITLNGEELKNGNFLPLFSPDVYDELFIISYVSSYKFFFENIKDFKKVTLILGEEENIARFLSPNIKDTAGLLKDIKDSTIAQKL